MWGPVSFPTLCFVPQETRSFGHQGLAPEAPPHAVCSGWTLWLWLWLGFGVHAGCTVAPGPCSSGPAWLMRVCGRTPTLTPGRVLGGCVEGQS